MKASILTITSIIFFSCFAFCQTQHDDTLMNGIYQTSENGIELALHNQDDNSLKIDSRAVLSFSEIVKTEDYIHPMTSQPAIKLILTEAGSIKIREASSENLGKPLAIIVDNKILVAPIVREVISGGTLEITGKHAALIQSAIRESQGRG